ncbi:MAG: hypothetical protein WA777_02890 [Rhodanobacter sp.]
MLVTWLGYDDLEQLIRRALFVPGVGHTIAYGTSANRDIWWDNRQAAALGFTPVQSSEPFRAKVESAPPLSADDPASWYQGGGFVNMGPFGD